MCVDVKKRQINQKRWRVSNLKHLVKLYTGKARHKNVPLSWAQVTGTTGTMNTWGTSTAQHWGNYTVNTGSPIPFWSLLSELLLSTYFTAHSVHSVQIYWQSPTCWGSFYGRHWRWNKSEMFLAFRELWDKDDQTYKAAAGVMVQTQHYQPWTLLLPF